MLNTLQRTKLVFCRSVRPYGAASVLAFWRAPGWSLLFDATLGRRNPGCSEPVGKWMSLLREIDAEQGSVTLLLSSTGVLIAIGRDAVYSLPLGETNRQDLADAHRIWSALRQSGAVGMRALVDYDFKLRGAGDLLHARTTRLMPVSREDRPRMLAQTLTLLRGDSTRGLVAVEFRDEIDAMLAGPHGPWPHLRDRATRFLAQDWRLVRAHCDLTPNNLMQLNGSPRLIDLDRINDGVPAFFDPLHFAVEAHAKDALSSWLVVTRTPPAALRSAVEAVACADAPGMDWRNMLDFYILLRAAVWRRLDGVVGEAARRSTRLHHLLTQVDDRLARQS